MRQAWESNGLAFLNAGETCLALPKLNLQFLTAHDYLLRNFNLFRLEATYEIREDLADVLSRVTAMWYAPKTNCLPVMNTSQPLMASSTVGVAASAVLPRVCLYTSGWAVLCFHGSAHAMLESDGLRLKDDSTSSCASSEWRKPHHGMRPVPPLRLVFSQQDG